MKSILLALALLPCPALAQTVVGTSAIEGRRIEILEDRTWRYAEPGPTGACLPVSGSVEFCGIPAEWKPVPKQGVFSILYRHDDRTIGGFIAERIGSADGMSFAVMSKGILAQVGALAGTAPEMVPVLSTSDDTVSGFRATTMVYGAKIEGVSLVYANSIVVGVHDLVQVVTWEIGTDYTEAHRAAHADFVNDTRLTLEQDPE